MRTQLGWNRLLVRRLTYCLWPTRALPKAALYYVFQRLALWGARQKREFDGIIIAEVGPNSISTKHFIGQTVGALQLIRDADAKRFRRVKREIRYILNAPLLSLAQYERVCRTCRVDFSRFDFDIDESTALVEYASTLVHEATHGYLHSRYVIRRRSDGDRIERLCIMEEMRFARRLGVNQDARAQGVDAEILASSRLRKRIGSMDFRGRLRYVLDRWR